MNLRIRITMGFLVIVFIMTLVAGIILWQQAKMQTAFINSNLTGELEHYLLECRRQEKNFLLRKDNDSSDLFQANFDTLFTLTTDLGKKISEASIVSELSLLQDRLSNYQAEFEQAILYFDVELYQKQFEESMCSCIMFARESHKIIKKINTVTEDQFNAALSISSIVNTFSVILGIFLSVIIAGFITDKVMDLIGTPEGELIKYSHSKKEKKNK